MAPLIIEQSKFAGGLMQSISNGEYIMDVGRKELYTRLPKVDTLWKEILKQDYIQYEHREGILYQGKILETSSAWRGMRRGMPLSMIWRCAIDCIIEFLKGQLKKPVNYQQYWYKNRGKLLSQILSQGYEEKFKGVKWSDLPFPDNEKTAANADETSDRLLDHHVSERAKRTWRHPAKGTGQICDLLLEKSRMAGATFAFEAQVSGIITSGLRIESIDIEDQSGVTTYLPQHVISSAPAEMMVQLLDRSFSQARDNTPPHNAPTGLSMTTICVYLFLDEPPRFPHVWLKVSSPDMHIGRITNYSAFNGRMVPDGKTCLCIEYFCTPSNPMLILNDKQLYEHTIVECAAACLIDIGKCSDFSVLKLMDKKAALNWRDWDNARQNAVLNAINRFDNFYYINRPGTDKATYAGLEAADAILSRNRDIHFREMALSLPGWKGLEKSRSDA
jgi:protoporphyrinogen oxidase